MAYVVNVNDPLQPSNAKGAGQAAEELRAIKLKISGFIRNNDASYVFSVPTRFDAGLETSALKTTSLEVTNNIVAGSIVAPTFVGMVATFCTTAIPVGWLKLNGQTISRTTYAALFALVGTTFGAGDGVTTFKLPDVRGRFLRFWDDGIGLDSGRILGSNQAQDTASHTHPGVKTYEHVGGDDAALGNNSPNGRVLMANRQIRGNNPPCVVVGFTVDASEGGTETRPVNVAFMACIKY